MEALEKSLKDKKVRLQETLAKVTAIYKQDYPERYERYLEYGSPRSLCVRVRVDICVCGCMWVGGCGRVSVCGCGCGCGCGWVRARAV